MIELIAEDYCYDFVHFMLVEPVVHCIYMHMLIFIKNSFHSGLHQAAYIICWDTSQGTFKKIYGMYIICRDQMQQWQKHSVSLYGFLLQISVSMFVWLTFKTLYILLRSCTMSRHSFSFPTIVHLFLWFHRWAEWNGKYRDDVRRFIKVMVVEILAVDIIKII